MQNSKLTEVATRPTVCPSCNGKIIDTLAKVITATTLWRCRECDQTWTIATQKASSPRPR
jgi:ribosomal protein L37AE/L43A